MSLPYESATSGTNALQDISKILTKFGCSRVGTMMDNAAGETILQFTWRGRDVSVRASYKGYAAAYLKEHPYNPPRHRWTLQEHQQRAAAQAQISVCSVLRDWIKGQITACETGILSFEGAFLGQILLPNSTTTVLEAVEQKKLLPQLEAA